jgi:hypothetical protein
MRKTLGYFLALYYQKQAASLTKATPLIKACITWRSVYKVGEGHSEGVPGQSQLQKGMITVNIWRKFFYAETKGVRSFK